MRSKKSGSGTFIYVVMGDEYPEAVFSHYDDAAIFVKNKLAVNIDLKIRWHMYSLELDEHVENN